MMTRACRSIHILAVMPILILCFTPRAGGAQTERGAFVILVGADTVAVETFSRRSDALDGEIRGRGIGRITYAAVIGGDASVQSLALQYWPPTGDTAEPPTQGAEITVVGDTVVLQITEPSGIDAQRFPTQPGAFIYLNPSFLLTEQMVLHARTRGGDAVAFPVFMAQGGETAPVRVTSPGADTVEVSILGSDIRGVMDAAGRLSSAAIPAQGVAVIRLPSPPGTQ